MFEIPATTPERDVKLVTRVARFPERVSIFPVAVARLVFVSVRAFSRDVTLPERAFTRPERDVISVVFPDTTLESDARIEFVVERTPESEARFAFVSASPPERVEIFPESVRSCPLMADIVLCIVVISRIF